MASGKGDLNYASEKLGSAVRIMATSHGTLQERLLKGWMNEGHRALPMGPGQAGIPMSDELIEKLEDFDERMSCAEDTKGEGTFRATILNLSDEEASEAADDLMNLSYEVKSELRDARP